MIFKKLLTPLRESLELPDFIRNYFAPLILELNQGLHRLTLQENFGCDIKTVTIPSGGEVNISHTLQIVPKYWIILRRRGNSVVEDGKIWNEKLIALKNSGSQEVTITVGIFRR